MDSEKKHDREIKGEREPNSYQNEVNNLGFSCAVHALVGTAVADSLMLVAVVPRGEESRNWKGKGPRMGRRTNLRDVVVNMTSTRTYFIILHFN